MAESGITKRQPRRPGIYPFYSSLSVRRPFVIRLFFPARRRSLAVALQLTRKQQVGHKRWRFLRWSSVPPPPPRGLYHVPCLAARVLPPPRRHLHFWDISSADAIGNQYPASPRPAGDVCRGSRQWPAFVSDFNIIVAAKPREMSLISRNGGIRPRL